MKFFRNNAYWILGIVIGIGISSIILIQRYQPQTDETGQKTRSEKTKQKETLEVHTPDHGVKVVKPPPPGETAKTGYWHGDRWHRTAPSLATRRNAKNVRSSTPTYTYYPGTHLFEGKDWRIAQHYGGLVKGPQTLPDDIEVQLMQLDMEKRIREGLVYFIENKDWPPDKALKQQLYTAYHGDFDLIESSFVEYRHLLKDPQPMSDEEYKERQSEILTGDMDNESAVNFLVRLGLYDAPLLNRLDTLSAFKYLKAIEGHHFRSGGGSESEKAREYAKRVITENPNNLEARLYLADSEKDEETAIVQYQEILQDHPDSVHALIESGCLLCMGNPLEAIHYLKKAHNLGSPIGHSQMAIAYQRLGDLKTAWIHYKKAEQLPHGRALSFYIEAIEAGAPLIQPLPRKEIERQLDIGRHADTWKGIPFPENTDLVPE